VLCARGDDPKLQRERVSFSRMALEIVGSLAIAKTIFLSLGSMKRFAELDFSRGSLATLFKLSKASCDSARNT